MVEIKKLIVNKDMAVSMAFSLEKYAVVRDLGVNVFVNNLRIFLKSNMRWILKEINETNY